MDRSQQQILSAVDCTTLRSVQQVSVILVMAQMLFVLVGFNVEFEHVYKLFGIDLSSMHSMSIIALITSALLLLIIVTVVQVYVIVKEEKFTIFFFMFLQISGVIYQVFEYIPQLIRTPHHVALHVTVLLISVLLYGLYSTYLWMLVNKNNGLASSVSGQFFPSLVYGVRQKTQTNVPYVIL